MVQRSSDILSELPSSVSLVSLPINLRPNRPFALLIWLQLAETRHIVDLFGRLSSTPDVNGLDPPREEKNFGKYRETQPLSVGRQEHRIPELTSRLDQIAARGLSQLVSFDLETAYNAGRRKMDMTQVTAPRPKTACK